MVNLPTVLVGVAFGAGASTSTYLHLGDPARGLLGTGTLATTDVFEDLTGFWQALSTKRGSSRVDSPILRYEAGTSTCRLNNSDRRFDPTNLAGPYVSLGATQVTPMRAVRYQATWAGVTYDLWRGYADSWDIDYAPPNYSSCVLAATDGFKVLSQYERAAGAGVGAGEDTGARVGRILDGVGWSATDRIVAVGDSTVQATTLAGDALSELQLTAESEIGDLYVDGGGRVVFRNRHALLEDSRSTTSQATFGDGGGSELPYTDVELVYDEATLANLVRATRVGGAAQTVQDATSQALYLTRPYERSDLILQTDADAADWARYVLYQSKDPELRFSQLRVNPLRDPASLFPQVLGRDIGDRITIIRRPPGGGTITREVYIRGVQHDITPSTWMTTWTLQSASKFAFLILGDPELGLLGSNALAY